MAELVKVTILLFGYLYTNIFEQTSVLIFNFLNLKKLSIACMQTIAFILLIFNFTCHVQSQGNTVSLLLYTACNIIIVHGHSFPNFFKILYFQHLVSSVPT